MLLAHGGGEKSDSFSRGANKTASPCETSPENFSENPALRENGLQHPAKGGSTPAFACQHAAIAPLPCPNL